MTSQPWPDLAG
ncbi:hypothetical protein E2C01_075982 [Portunus trituberculatus]|uniref:Uncharacterized protein n=1 Tax=Portunus trituberculatus TaxID=210409 RepID=A0A5B7IA69_PORTR|nr:hypothetical protein [Portunus trituberculatus]